MSWRRDRGQTFRTLVQSRMAARQSPDAHENISSVVTRMMAAADEEASGADAAMAASGLATVSSGMMGPLGAGAAAPPDGISRQTSGVGPSTDRPSAVNVAVPAGEEPTTALLAAAPQYSDSTATAMASTPPYAPADTVTAVSPRINGPDVGGASALSTYCPAGLAATAVAGTQPAAVMAQMPLRSSASGSAALGGSQPSEAPIAAHALPPAADTAGLGWSSQGTLPPAGPLVALIQRLHGAVAPGDTSGSHGRPMPRDLASWMDGGAQAYDTPPSLSRPLGVWPGADQGETEVRRRDAACPGPNSNSRK